MRFLAGFWLLALAVACACTSSPAATRYPLTGQILGVQLDTGQVLLKHEAVPGYMDAMAMPFQVADRTTIRDRRPGDLIDATLVVDGERSRLEDVQWRGRAPLDDDAAGPPIGAGVRFLAPGDEAPADALASHRGGTVALPDWRGTAVVVTFIYTRCPLPEFCPLLDRRFAAVQDAAAADPSLAGRVRLLSVSFDPEADTPEILAAHAAKVGARGDWHFVTAPRETVDRFAAAFGVTVIREADRTITHNLRTAVVGPDGRVAVLRSGNDWTADDLIADVRQALGAAPTD
jgi:protein SCO1/2